MKVAIILALCAMLAVATAFYPEHYYGGWHGYPYYASVAAAAYYGHPYYGHPYYSGWGYGYHPYYGLNFNQAGKVTTAITPTEPAVTEPAVAVAE